MADNQPARTLSASVPLNPAAGGIDTSALSQAIQSIIAENTPTEKRVNPATYIHESGIRMVDLYAVYEKLRIIGAKLNGKLTSDPIPDTLQIENVTINFRTVEGETVSETQSVALTHLNTVGDLSNLLATELGSVIVLLQRETDAVLDIATRTKDMCAKSRKAWEEANKDKKILEETVDGAAETIADAVQSALNETGGAPTLNNLRGETAPEAVPPVLTAYADQQ